MRPNSASSQISDPNVHQTPLDRALIAITQDPSARPDFYRTLLDSDLYLIKYGSDAALEGQRTLEDAETFSFQSIEVDGNPYLPVFSSLDALQTFLQAEGRYIAMNALDFMSAVRGIDLFLNPGSDYTKDFTQAEIAAIVDGSIFQLLE